MSFFFLKKNGKIAGNEKTGETRDSYLEFFYNSDDL